MSLGKAMKLRALHDPGLEGPWKTKHAGWGGRMRSVSKCDTFVGLLPKRLRCHVVALS
jgi:hypothetical protein